MKLYFTPAAKTKLELYIQLADPAEVSGLGKVERLGRDGFLCTDIVLFEQESSWGGTELSQEAVAEFFATLIGRGEDPGQYRLWWHSHGHHQCFWSRTDVKTIERLGDSWLVSVVGNAAGDLLARLDVFEPVHLWGELSTEVYLEADAQLAEMIKKELSEKVRFRKPQYPLESEWGRWYRSWGEEEEDGDSED